MKALLRVTPAAILAILFLLSGAQAQEAQRAPDPAAGTVGATLTAHIMIRTRDVKWIDGPPSLPPGAKIAVIEGDPKAPNALFTYRLKFPNGYKVAPHFHPADEHLTVIAGTLNMGSGDKFDEKATTALGPGGFAVMPHGYPHFAWAKGETIIQVHAVGPWGITYVNPSDDPRSKKTASVP